MQAATYGDGMTISGICWTGTLALAALPSCRSTTAGYDLNPSPIQSRGDIT